MDLAADYLLLIAAAEGHLLKRSAVASLYEATCCDLRAAIAELDLWCQMGVGDPRGGLSWIYQRYPPGSDLDQHGRRLRVVSEGTYQSGMGLSPGETLDDQSQLLWMWHELGIDPSALLGWNDMHATEWRPSSLKGYTSFADSLSAADVYARLSDEVLLDMTQNPMTDKARSQYIEGMHLLQTDDYIDYIGLTANLAIASILSIYQATELLKPGNIRTKLRKSPSLRQQSDGEHQTLSRHDFTCFDPISIPAESALSSGSGLAQSAFDGPLEPIATDLAPYVRSIAQYDLALAEQREQVNGVGRNGKRARTTRAARSALEGSQRASTRRERWFGKQLDLEAVIATGGKGWPVMDLAVMEEPSRDESEAPASSGESAGVD